VQRHRQPLPLSGYGNVVDSDATSLVLQDIHIAVRVANLLAEAEGVTTEDPKSRFGDSLITICISHRAHTMYF
jgi:hypothetical protein